MIFNFFILPTIIMGIVLIINNNRKISFIASIVGILISITFLILISLNFFNEINHTKLQDIFYFYDSLYSLVVIFIMVFILNTIFVLSQHEINFKELGLLFLYFIFAMGVILSKDFLSLITYLELLSLSGAAVILLSSHPSAKKVAIKYLVIHLLGGSIFMIGAIEYIKDAQSIAFPNSSLNLEYTFNYFMLIGLLINLGLPPLSSWLIDAYSKSSINASLYLSVFTTKASLFIVLILFHNNIELMYFGIILSTYGFIFSSFETNLRKILSFAIIQQLGIMLIIFALIDLSTSYFVISYLIVSILYKTILFMLSGVLQKKYHTNNIKKLKNIINLKSSMGIILIFSSIQVLGLPFSGGFVAKTQILEQISNNSIVSLIIIIMLVTATLNIGIRVPLTLLNFKNNSHKIILEKKSKLISFFLPILLLQAIYFMNLHHVNLTSILHSLEIVGFGVVLYVIINLLIFKNKEEKIQNLVKHIKNSMEEISLKSLHYLINMNIFKPLQTIYMALKYRLYTNLSMGSYVYSQKLVLVSLYFLVILYITLRLFN